MSKLALSLSVYPKFVAQCKRRTANKKAARNIAPLYFAVDLPIR
jgi:hypothetical protein